MSDTPPEVKTRHQDADTQQRLIRSALRVFSEKGIDAATVREITADAGANIAAVNYHFGSKDELIRCALEACLRPVNEARIRALNQCIAASGEAGAPLEQIIEALVRPTVEESLEGFGGRSTVRLLLQVRALPRPLTNTILSEQFDHAHRLFQHALAKALPDLTAREIALRYDFARGAIMQILGDLDPAARHLPGLETTPSHNDSRQMTEHLVAFIVAGFRAPPTRASGPSMRP